MIGKQEIMRYAKALNLSANTIQKDYVLNWLLLGIYSSADLAQSWLFKGGTCLKKCYFKDYRFSEDLDFTLKHQEHLEPAFLKEQFSKIGEWIYENSGVDIPNDHISFEQRLNLRGKPSVEGKIGYKGPMQRQSSISRVKLDLTCDELLCDTPVYRALYHPYSDDLPNFDGILTYSLEEIFAEKCRALIERMRPRDLYDVVHLYNKQRDKIDVSKYIQFLKDKCKFKNVEIPTYDALSNRAEYQELVTEWENMLAHQIGKLESCQIYWQQLPKIFDWIESEKNQS